MATQFKTGDLVKLKTSNIKMTVKGFATKPSSSGVMTIEDRYICAWYDGEKEQRAVFHKDALDLCTPSNAMNKFS
jgi:uncharacterized protein YodC (DUF2158 family)